MYKDGLEYLKETDREIFARLSLPGKVGLTDN